MNLQKEVGQSKTFQQKEKSKNIFWIFLWVILLVVLLSMIFFWRQLQKPTSGQIKVVAPVSTASVENVRERFEGKYFSFAHDSKYLLKNHQKDFANKGVLLETAFFAQSDVNSKKIAVTVEDIKERTMADTGNFLMRENNPKVYAQEKFEIADVKGISFSTVTDSGFMEKVFFIPRDEYVAEFAFTQPITGDNLAEMEIEDILKSIQWKK